MFLVIKADDYMLLEIFSITEYVPCYGRARKMVETALTTHMQGLRQTEDLIYQEYGTMVQNIFYDEPSVEIPVPVLYSLFVSIIKSITLLRRMKPCRCLKLPRQMGCESQEN